MVHESEKVGLTPREACLGVLSLVFTGACARPPLSNGWPTLASRGEFSDFLQRLPETSEIDHGEIVRPCTLSTVVSIPKRRAWVTVNGLSAARKLRSARLCAIRSR